MIYHCNNDGCNYWGEGEERLEHCPQCGGQLQEADEKKMSGDDWCALGIYWVEREDGKERAYQYFRKAAQMGSAWGVCNLGLCMEQGIGVEADPRQAIWLYEQAAEMGSLAALCNLGVCYQSGIGTVEQPNRAAEVYEKAADYGSLRADRKSVV